MVYCTFFHLQQNCHVSIRNWQVIPLTSDQENETSWRQVITAFICFQVVTYQALWEALGSSPRPGSCWRHMCTFPRPPLSPQWCAGCRWAWGVPWRWAPSQGSGWYHPSATRWMPSGPPQAGRWWLCYPPWSRTGWAVAGTSRRMAWRLKVTLSLILLMHQSLMRKCTLICTINTLETNVCSSVLTKLFC